eukprot:1458743-Rhodomonas_salina.1
MRSARGKRTLTGMMEERSASVAACRDTASFTWRASACWASVGLVGLARVRRSAQREAGNDWEKVSAGRGREWWGRRRG